MKKYEIFAGVNGAGKSTLYATNHVVAGENRVNTDEILKNMGGHGIPDADVERRYGESLKNLYKLIPLCDLVDLYDNTQIFRRFAIIRKGEIVRLSANVPSWFDVSVLK